jgi:hypothetical protein
MKKIREFKSFLEALSQHTDDKELIRALTEGFDHCYPVASKISAFVECAIGGDKVDGAKKIIEAGMEGSGISDFDSYRSTIDGEKVDPAFEAEIRDMFEGSALPEADGSKLGNLMKVLALSAGLATGAHAADADSSATKAPTEKFQEDKTGSLDDVLKGAMGAKATHYVTEKNKHNTDTVKKLGEKAKEAAGVQAG